MSDDRGYKIQSVEKAVHILCCFKQEPKLGILDISKMVNLPKSTVFGIVDTLAALGMLTRDPISNKYELGIEIYLLSLHSNITLRNIALPYLRSLVAEFGETANLVTHDNTHIIYNEKLESPHAMRICTTAGQKLPFYCSGVGRSILAYLPEEQINAALLSYDYAPYTPNTPRNAQAVFRQLEQIRQQGYCIDDEEFEVGILCVGVPILTPQKTPIAGISVSGPKSRMEADTCHRIASVLLDYAAKISKELYN
jgi:DNA-binding IclR family transcriptional regulator